MVLGYNTSTNEVTFFTSSSNSTTSTIIDISTNTNFYPTFVSATSGNLPINVDSNLTYNPSSDTLSVGYINLRNPFLMDEFVSAGGSPFQWNFSGAGTGSFFSGTFAPTLANVGIKRLGLFTMNSQASAGNNYYAQSSDAVYCPYNIQSLTFGFIPLGNGSLSAIGTDVGNINQAFGLALGISPTDTQTTSIMWRLSSNSAGIPSWSLVENNVVKETITGTNLTGGLTNKWCRAQIIFSNDGTKYYGLFTNLTNGVTYGTLKYVVSNPSTLCQLYIHTGTTDNIAKQIAFDYLILQNGCYPIGPLSNINSSSAR
jgi:hypothetical protein